MYTTPVVFTAVLRVTVIPHLLIDGDAFPSDPST
jgi:hypothetical protein